MALEHYFLESTPSTHQYVLEGLKNNTLQPPVVITAREQTQGVGSRGNQWEGGSGNLFLSLCVKEEHLPKDLPLASVSIYFGMIAKQILCDAGSRAWVKWPNDLYVESQKIGGIMSIKTGACIVVSMGINLKTSSPPFGVLDTVLEAQGFLESFLNRLSALPSWKNIFSKYKLEFEHSKVSTCHIGEEKVSLREALLCSDGSIQIGNKKVYSLR